MMTVLAMTSPIAAPAAAGIARRPGDRFQE